MRRTKPPGPSREEMLVDRELIHDLELKLDDLQQDVRDLRHLLGLATGRVKSKSKIAPTVSATGLESKCVELAKRHQLFPE